MMSPIKQEKKKIYKESVETRQTLSPRKSWKFPPKFYNPHLESYKGCSDANDHISYFVSITSLSK